MKRWDSLLDGYLAEYAARGRSPQTVAHVTRVLEQWGAWMKRRRPRPKLEQIDADLIVRFMASRSAFRAKATVYHTLSTMRGMGEYLMREGVWEKSPLRWMQGPKISPYHRLPRRIDREHMDALWREAATSRGDCRRHLWITTLALLYGTGLRRGELERLDVASWNRDEGILCIDGRKTGQQRNVPVPELAYRCLEAYLPARHNYLEQVGRIDEPALLINRHGERLTGTAISLGVHGMARRCGVDLRGLHQFRHTCASDLLEAGVRLPEVQQILGHQQMSTTMRYLHIADPERRAAVALHPINQWIAREAA